MLSLQRTNSTIFNSGDLLLRQVGFAVALAPWPLRFLQLEVAIGYVLSGWAKLQGKTWHDGTAVGLALRIEDLQRFAAPDWLFEQRILLNLLTWGTLAFEVSFLMLVWSRRLRPWVLGVGVLIHLGIDIFLDIGFFSYAMLLAYVAFLPPDVADRVVVRLRPVRGTGSVASVALAVEPAQ